MVKGEIVFRLAVLLIITLSTAGCLSGEEKKGEGIAQAPKPEGELQKAGDVSKDIEYQSEKSRANSAVISKKAEYTLDERDRLKESLAIVSDELKDAKAGLLAYDTAYDDLYKEFQELVDERNAAIARTDGVQARVGGLSNRLSEISRQLPEFEQWNKELQVTVEDLKVQVEEIIGRSTEQSTEGFSGKLPAIPELEVDYYPTPQDVVEKMLELAEIKEDDLVYDLGCGDGRIVITAAKKYGCKAVGYEIDPQVVKEALENVESNKVGHLVRIEQKDIFTLDLAEADVVTLYLLPKLNVKLIPQLKRLKRGSRIVSHNFGMALFGTDKDIKIMSDEDNKEHRIYLWTSPLRIIHRKRI
jgi:hypothetical protein